MRLILDKQINYCYIYEVIKVNFFALKLKQKIVRIKEIYMIEKCKIYRLFSNDEYRYISNRPYFL